MRALIVDDSNIMRRAIAKYLEPLGIEVAANAGDGEAALELFAKHEPDLVTLDITMPRMDGLVCLEEMMRRKPGAKIIVISALKDSATGLRALKLGAKGFLPKPFTEKELVAEVGAVMGDLR